MIEESVEHLPADSLMPRDHDTRLAERIVFVLPALQVLDRLEQLGNEILPNAYERLASPLFSHEQVLTIRTDQVALNQVILEIVGGIVGGFLREHG